jgi:MoaA/NifB/PqqE/SkfB family radical SAM enzyme
MSSKLLKNYLPEIFALGFARSKPAMVTVNLTRRCNQHCVYCEIGISPPSMVKDTLTLDDLKWVIDQMAEQKIPKISLCGGEPFLFAGIIDLVAYAGKKNIRCSITTNGMTAHALTDPELETLKRCKTEVNISIDSFRDEINSLTRGSTVALSNALKSIDKLREKEIPVTVLTVISKFNFQDLSQFFAEACERGIKQVLFQPVIYYSNYPDRPTVENKSQFNVGMDQIDRLMEELKNILNFEKTHQIKTNVYRIFPWIQYYLKTAAGQNGHWFFQDVLPKFYCREIYAIIDISYDGGIQPCGLRPATVSIMNNRQSGLLGLWSEATEKTKNDLGNEKYYDCCNGCCHHFSRNMLASLAKYPVQNRMALIRMAPLMLSRIGWGMWKKRSI